MDGEFACPECGQIVKVRRLGSGRQVRCTFCKRLLEVPFLPRASNGWRRGPSGQPRWVVWAWVAVGFVAVALISTAAMQLILSQERAARARSIERLVASSEANEQSGRLDMALLDLDSALQILPSAPGSSEHAKALRDRRQALVRRDVQSVIKNLDDRDASALGDWLNVQARVGADQDLGPLAAEVRAKFQAALNRWIDASETAARSAAESQRPVEAVALCATAASAAVHLPPDARAAALRRLGAIVVPLIERQGVVIAPPAGEFIFGAEAGYDKSMRPVMVKTLTDKGYLPPSPNSPWRDDWSRAPYRLSVSIHERQEGNYMATQNRLTRIEARIVFSHQGREVWKSIPNARTTVPLPSIPSFLSTRLALSAERLPDVEKMLFENAQAMIGDRFKSAIAGIPDFSRPPLSPVAQKP
jgi:hypothetical protein